MTEYNFYRFVCKTSRRWPTCNQCAKKECICRQVDSPPSVDVPSEDSVTDDGSHTAHGSCSIYSALIDSLSW